MCSNQLINSHGIDILISCHCIHIRVPPILRVWLSCISHNLCTMHKPALVQPIMHLAQQNYFLHLKERQVKKANKPKQSIMAFSLHFQLQPPPVTNFHHRKPSSWPSFNSSPSFNSTTPSFTTAFTITAFTSETAFITTENHVGNGNNHVANFHHCKSRRKQTSITGN